MSKKTVQPAENAIRSSTEKTTNFATLAVLGPKNTYSDFAADKFLSRRGTKGDSPRALKPARKKYFRSIAEIFKAVEKGDCETGIVPLENIIYGSIRETYDLLVSSRVHITDKFGLAIDHVMAALPGTRKSDIHIIASHEQALEQCREYLSKHFRSARKEYHTSTIAALEKMINDDDRGMAVIIPSQAAGGLPLKIIAKKPQGRKNTTTFIVIKKGLCPKNPPENPGSHGKKNETSIAFYFRSDSPGSLFTVFREFANEGINLSYIESRPSLEIPGNYVFYLNYECAGTSGQTANRPQKVLYKIRPMLAGLKILGIYPKR